MLLQSAVSVHRPKMGNLLVKSATLPFEGGLWAPSGLRHMFTVKDSLVLTKYLKCYQGIQEFFVSNWPVITTLSEDQFALGIKELGFIHSLTFLVSTAL